MRKVLDTINAYSDPCCRICSASEPNIRKLTVPCKCIGDLKYAHSNCILAWILKTKNKKCFLCNYEIKLKHTPKKNSSCTVPEICIFYIEYIRRFAGQWAYRKIARTVYLAWKIVRFLLFIIFFPFAKLFSLSIFSPFLSVSRFIRTSEMEKTHKKNTYTLLDTITKLSMFSEYNTLYSEINNIAPNDIKLERTSKEEIRNIFNVIVFEEDLESGEQASHMLLDYFVFFSSLAVIGLISYIANSVDEMEGDFVLIYILVPTAMALLLVYSLICCCKGILRKYSIQNKWVGILTVYCKLLIILLLRFGIFPYFIGWTIISYLKLISFFQVFDLEKISSVLGNSLAIFFGREEATSQFILSIRKSAIDSFLLGLESVLAIVIGNSSILAIDVLNRKNPSVIRPGISSWLFPMDIFLTRIVKDSIFTNIIGYCLIMLIVSVSILLSLPLLIIVNFVENYHVHFKTDLLDCPVKMVAWVYYYIPLILFIQNGMLRSSVSGLFSFFRSVQVFLSGKLKLDSLLFDGPLPSGDVDLKHLQYLPCKNSMPYNQNEIRKRRRLAVTKAEKEMYFNEKGEKKRILKDRIIKLDEKDKDWACCVISSNREDLLYNPLYSIFYVPSLYVVRILILLGILLFLYLLMAAFTGLAVMFFIFAVEDIRSINCKDYSSIMMNCWGPFIFLLCVEVVRLIYVYRSRIYFIQAKLIPMLGRYLLALSIPFSASVFSSLLRKVFVTNTCRPFILENDRSLLTWGISYGVGADMFIRNSQSSVWMLLWGILVLFLYGVTNQVLFFGKLAEGSVLVKSTIILILFFSRPVYKELHHLLRIGRNLPFIMKEKIIYYNTELVLEEYKNKLEK